MREVVLVSGLVAFVDDADYDLVSGYSWIAFKQPNKPQIYARTSLQYKPKRIHIFMHKLITGFPQTDHKDGNGLNNQRENLRECSKATNCWNSSKRRRGNFSSIYKGVYWDKKTKKWVATVQQNKKQVVLGYFVDEIEAAKAYDSAAELFYGEFARTNFGERNCLE